MTIKDIAKICGVSPSTVSKILNSKDDDISLETRKKVLAVIKEYQYVPYSKVINSVQPKTNLIGVLVSVLPSELHGIVDVIEAEMAENGYSIILCNTQGIPEKMEKYLHILEVKNVDGIIFIEQNMAAVETCKVPAVAVWAKAAKTQNSFVADVWYEQEEMEYEAVVYLLKKNHQKIGYLLDREGDLRGYEKAHLEHGMTVNHPYIYRTESMEEMVLKGIPHCLNMGVTAILCCNEMLAAKVYERLRERGDQVPEGVSVIAMGSSHFSELFFPTLTTVGIDIQELGKKASQGLTDMLEERKTAYECSGQLSPQLAAGKSVLPLEVSGQLGKLVVVGSMNMDCSISVAGIPTGGETLIADNMIMLPGGKGANQAVGAGKLGGLVYMIGYLGNDMDGKQIYDNLVMHGVRMDGVAFARSLQTGKAFIHIAPDGESAIVVYPGANEKLDALWVLKNRQLFQGARYCLLSLEIGSEAAKRTVEECEKFGVGVIVKPSAVSALKEELYPKITYLVPNEKEFDHLFPGAQSIEEKAGLLLKKGVKNVIVTLGRNGCYLRNEQYSRFFPAIDFQSVDTTGGADAFISALAVYLSEGNHLVHAIGFATYAASISTTRYGVQSAMIDREGLEVYREEIVEGFRV